MRAMKLVVAFCAAGTLLAAPGDLIKIITQPPALVAGANFTVSATVRGHLVIGAPGLAGTGSVFLMSGVSGHVRAEIQNPDPGVGLLAPDNFGVFVTEVNGNLLVSASQNDPGGFKNAGMAYLLDGRKGGVLLTIPNPEPGAGDQFGYGPTAAVGGKLIVGSPFDDPPDRWSDAGTVYVFDEKTGDMLLRIPHPDPDPYSGGNVGDAFGRAMAVHEGNILVGAAQDDPGGVQAAGAVYLVDINTGQTLMTIPNPYPGEFDFFSYPVASINGKIVAAAPRAEVGGVKGAGAVYVFDGKTGALLNRIEHPYPSRVTNGQGNFGWSFAAHGSYLAVTSTGTDVAGYQAAGALYVFDFNTGSLLLEIPNPHPAKNAYFGRGGVTFHGGQIATGSAHPDGILNAGAIYLFEGF